MNSHVYWQVFESTHTYAKQNIKREKYRHTTRRSYQPSAGKSFYALHYAFDSWMTEKFPKCPWERYADDGIIHCVSRKQEEFVLNMLKEQMKLYGLAIHPEKSNIVFCGRNNESVPKGVGHPLCFWDTVFSQDW